MRLIWDARSGKTFDGDEFAVRGGVISRRLSFNQLVTALRASGDLPVMARVLNVIVGAGGIEIVTEAGQIRGGMREDDA